MTTCLIGGNPDIFPTIGYQLDWIFYKGSKLQLNNVFDHVDVLKQNVDPPEYCSDHSPLVAEFELVG